MQTADVIKWFNGNQTAVAKALGVTKATVSKWKQAGVVPPLPAAKLQRLTGGALKFDPDTYPLRGSKPRAA